VIGHSAGGTLALWAAARHRLPDGAPGANPRIRPIAVVAQAAICDLDDGAQHRLGGGAVEQLMVDGDYALASPAALLPIGVPLYVTTTAQDSAVPPEQSIAFAAAASAAGDQVTLDVVPGEGHFAHLDPSSHCWRLAMAWLDLL
jgi:pimeloyl-ACP methyl ester carboxylesterase